MYELVDSETVSKCIARSPGRAEEYARLMAELAHTIHGVTAEDDVFPDAAERAREYIRGGIGQENAALAAKCERLLDALPSADTLVHGDFHTGNVFLQSGEPLLIDMDRIARGHPIIELSDLYYFYVLLGEDDPAVVEKFMGFSYETAKRFFRAFLKCYLGTEDEARLDEVTEKASLLGYSRMIRKLRKKRSLTDSDERVVERCVRRVAELTEWLDTLDF